MIPIDVYSSSTLGHAKKHYIKYLEEKGYMYRQKDLFRTEKACIVLTDELDYIDTIKLYHLVATVYGPDNVIILIGGTDNVREFKARSIEKMELVSRPLPNQRSHLVTESHAIHGILKHQFPGYLERNELPIPKQVIIDLSSFRTLVFKRYLTYLLSTERSLFIEKGELTNDH